MTERTASTPPIEVHDADEEEWTTQLYIAMVRSPDPSAEMLAGEGFTLGQIEAGTRALERRELIESMGLGRWRVRPPDVALRQLATNWETRAQFARAGAPELSAVWRQTQQRAVSPLVPGMRALHSSEEVVEALATAWNEATDTFNMMLDNSPACRRWLLGHPLRDDGWVWRDSVAERYLVHSGLLDDPDATAELQRRATAGVIIRVAHDVPFGLMTVDRHMVVCDSTRYSDEASGSFVHTGDPGVAPLTSLVDTLFSRASPFHPEGASAGPETGSLPLTRRDRRVLGFLAVGATDNQIARSLAISTRTVERRVRHIMETLGATTRFQAGVSAAQRGWL